MLNGLLINNQGAQYGTKVLVSDKLSETAIKIFKEKGIEVDFMLK